MKTMYKISFIAIALLFLSGCSKGPKSIDYGNDGCHYCKMTIVDKIHGAEIVTEKGKVFKFDATECMLNYTNDNPEVPVGNFYTNHYEAPTAFISATEATFLISENLPSPMGAYLTAFKNENEAEKIQAEIGGKRYNWDELKKYLKN